MIRKLFNARHLRHASTSLPQLSPWSASALAAAIRLVHQRDAMQLCVEGAGYGAPVDGDEPRLHVDLRKMRRIALSLGQRTISISGPVPVQQLDALSLKHGLATPWPRLGQIGAIGAALGGGTGLLTRRLGASCQQIIGAQLCLYDGQLLEVDLEHRPELLWALRGAGHVLPAIVTRLDLRLTPIPTTIHGGSLRWPAHHAPRIFERLWDLIDRAAPRDDLNLFVTISPEQGVPTLTLFGAAFGPSRLNRALFADLARLAPEVHDQTGPTTYAALQRGFVVPQGLQVGFAWEHGVLARRPDAALAQAVLEVMSAPAAAGRLRFNLELTDHKTWSPEGPIDYPQGAPCSFVAASLWPASAPAQEISAAMSSLDMLVDRLAPWSADEPGARRPGHPNYDDPWRPRSATDYFGRFAPRVEALCASLKS